MRALLLPSIAALALAGCGGGSGSAPPAPRPAAAPPRRAPATDAEVRRALRLPARVPLRATGRGSPRRIAVVRRWLDELRAGHVARAARLFAVPSRFQNFSALALIRTRAQAVEVTASLPCGGKMTQAGGARGFVIYEARLTDRPGGGCGAGTGGVVRGAVLVRGGRMVEWYRLPDAAPAPPAGPAV